MSRLLKERYPEILDFTRFAFTENPEILVGQEVFREEDKYFTDASMVEIFDLQLEVGSGTNPLASLGSTIVSQNLANKRFNGKKGIGEIISIDGKNYQVFSKICLKTHTLTLIC